MYKCGFCGSEYSDAKSYQVCVAKCCAEYEKVKAEADHIEKEAKRMVRIEELRIAQKKYEELRNKFLTEYPLESVTEKFGDATITYCGDFPFELKDVFPWLKQNGWNS